jgi:hypothetical protein
VGEFESLADAPRLQQYAGPACRLVTAAINAAGAQSWADGDGFSGMMWLPDRMLRQYFILPFDVEHIALACRTNTPADVFFYQPTPAGPVQIGSTRRTSNTNPNQDDVTKFYIDGPSSTPELRAGTVIRTTQDCMAIVDGRRTQMEMIIPGAYL